MKIAIIYAGVCFVTGFLAFGSGLPEAKAEQPVNIVATVGMVADITREVAGDKATVHSLIGEGIDPHLYKPTRQDVLQLTKADIVFYNGLLLEGKMADILEKLAHQGKSVHAVATLIADDQLLAKEGESSHHDPHIWMDVRLWSKAVERVAQILAEFRGEWAEDVQANVLRYKAELDLLNQYITEIMATIPDERRVLITAHDAFNYFGRAYNIEVLGIQGISTESEAGLNDINRLVDTLVQRKITAIFVETSVADRNVKALIEGANSRGHPVVIGGSLYSDAMGAAGTYEGTYIGMLDHNASTIARALGGQVPEGNFQAWRQLKTHD